MNKQIVIFLILKDAKLLVEKRNPDSVFAGELVFPGGMVEENETLEMAMFRESLEELGIIPIEFAPIPTDKTIYGFNNVVVNPFYITKWQGELPLKILDKGNPLLWIDIKDAENSKLDSVSQSTIAFKKYLEKHT